MRLSDFIHPRGLCIALIVNSGVTLAAVGVAAYFANQSRERSCPTPQVRVVEVAPPSPQWASTVRAFSSEYSSSSWSAEQALGAPNVYPRSGDEANAWASLDADAKAEFIELGFDQPQRTRALEIYETFNPGAITQVELITEQGARIVVPRRELRRSGGAAISSFGEACTRERIVGVRIAVASAKVAGWNEVDAVGLLPCQ